MVDQSFRVPFSPVLPIVSALACSYLMLNLSVETWLRFLAWMLLGACSSRRAEKSRDRRPASFRRRRCARRSHR
ncbi:amino acid permease C-terminal domain-containing protein [Micromonospora zamorensis]|uniref:amino acid permease C-terminal domain-containing protein n=1 Tax=Micromonospora zamorensis TaxID=709883 RepID=UPI0033E6B686